MAFPASCRAAFVSLPAGNEGFFLPAFPASRSAAWPAAMPESRFPCRFSRPPAQPGGVSSSSSHLRRLDSFLSPPRRPPARSPHPPLFPSAPKGKPSAKPSLEGTGQNRCESRPFHAGCHGKFSCRAIRRPGTRAHLRHRSHARYSADRYHRNDDDGADP